MLALAPTTLPDTPPLEYVSLAAEAGFDAIGLRLNRSPGLPFHPVVGVRELKSAVAASGLPVLDVYSFYLRPETDLEEYLPALELGAELGARYAVVMGDDPDWSRQRERFGRLCDRAGTFGLTCVLEFAVMRTLASLPQTVRLIEEAGRANAAVCLDPLNFVRGGGRPAELAALDPRLFPYLQLTDGFLEPGEPDPARLGRMGANRRCLMGEGDVPMREILAALPAGLALSVEFPPAIRPGVPAREWAKIVARTCRTYLDGKAQARQLGS